MKPAANTNKAKTKSEPASRLEKNCLAIIELPQVNRKYKSRTTQKPYLKRKQKITLRSLAVIGAALVDVDISSS